MKPADVHGLNACRVWDTQRAFQHLQLLGEVDSKRTAERRLQTLALLPAALDETRLQDEFGRSPNQLVLNWALERARRRRERVLFAQLYPLPDGTPCLHANDARGGRYWLPLHDAGRVVSPPDALARLRADIGKNLFVLPHGELIASLRNSPPVAGAAVILQVYGPVLPPAAPSLPPSTLPGPLRQLEAESIHLLREAASEARNPVMLCAMGKDSAVMQHLARKAFHPTPPPFPLLHIDTGWAFPEIRLLRDRLAAACGRALIVHRNPDADARGINPFDHGAALCTQAAETDGLRQALAKFGFDVAFCGSRRDENAQFADTSPFTLRPDSPVLRPQQMEPWQLHHGGPRQDACQGVFPLADWTELDIWHYIALQRIPVAPLYLADERPIVVRDGTPRPVADDRFRLLPGETISLQRVRFRKLGCYPLATAIFSDAASLPALLDELTQRPRPFPTSDEITKQATKRTRRGSAR